MKSRRKNANAVYRVWMKLEAAGWTRSCLAEALGVRKGQVTKFLSADTLSHDLKLFEKFAAVATRSLKKKHRAADFFRSALSWSSYDLTKEMKLRHRVDNEQMVLRGAQKKLSPEVRESLEKDLSPRLKKWNALNSEACDGLLKASISWGQVEKLFARGNDIDDWTHTTLARRVDAVLAEDYRSLHFDIGDAADAHFISQFKRRHKRLSEYGANASQVFAAYQGYKTRLCATIVDALVGGTPLDSDGVMDAVASHVEIFRNPATTLEAVMADAILGPYLETLRSGGIPSAKSHS